MKNKINSLVLVLINIISLTSVSQTENEVPLNTSSFDIQNGDYKKDIDNVFSNYIGTWEGIWNGKTLKLQIIKQPHQLKNFPNGDFYYVDNLIGKYSVTLNSTNTLLYSTFNITDLNETGIYNIGSGKNNKMVFFFKDILCGITCEFILERNLSNPNLLKYSYLEYQDTWYQENGCPYSNPSSVPMPLPKVNELTLIKL